MNYLILPLLFLGFFSFAQKDVPYYTMPGKPDSADIKRQIEMNEKVETETLDKLKLETDIQLPSLLKNFNLKMVPASKSGWYHHFKIDSSQSYIEAPVSIKGHIYIKAHYMGKELMTITKIRLKTGNATYESMPLIKNSRYITRRQGNKAHEILNLFAYENENDRELRIMYILSVIAMANNDAEIKIVFIGENDNFEATLTKENVKAIRESWYLSQYISYKANNYKTYTNRLHAPGMHETPTTFLMPKAPYTVDDMKGVADR